MSNWRISGDDNEQSTKTIILCNTRIVTELYTMVKSSFFIFPSKTVIGHKKGEYKKRSFVGLLSPWAKLISNSWSELVVRQGSKASINIRLRERKLNLSTVDFKRLYTNMTYLLLPVDICTIKTGCHLQYFEEPLKRREQWTENLNTKSRNLFFFLLQGGNEPFYRFLQTLFSWRLFHQIVGFPRGGGGVGVGGCYEIIAYQELFCDVTLPAR